MIKFPNNYKTTISIVLILLIILSCGVLFKPQKAEAIPVVVTWDIPRDAPVPAGLKENILDIVAWTVTKMVLTAMTNSIVNWINTGFEGNPTFVQNPSQFLGDAANQASGVFIHQLGAEDLLCSPFRPQIMLALRYLPSMEKFRCTFEDAKNNWEGFMNNFTNGGWKSWISITSQPQNNPYGAYLMAVDELEQRRAQARENAKTEASWGGGFNPLKKCVGGNTSQDYYCTYIACAGATSPAECRQQCAEASGTGLSTTELCQLSGGQMQNTTPGDIIADQLKINLGSSVRQMELADEMGEALAAIFNALINQLITGGLRSLSGGGGGGGGGGSWYETPPPPGEATNYTKIIDNVLIYEYQYRDAKQASINAYDETINKLKLLKTCYQNQSPVNQTRISEIQAQIDDYESRKISLKTEVNNSSNLINQAESIRSQMQNANSYSKINDLLNKFISEIQPLMHNAVDAENAKSEYESIKNTLIQKNSEIDTEYNQCLSGA